MSKRYVIQVLDTITDENATQVYEIATAENGQPLTAWFNVQHPAGGDWLTRSRTTALSDAAKLVQAGETRELRICMSRPVYAIVPLADDQGGYETIKQVAETIYNDHAAAPLVDDEDEDEDEDDENDVSDGQFEVVDEGNAVTHGDDPMGN